MDSDTENSVGKRVADGSVPESLQVAMVRNRGVQCMAFRDKDQKWRDYFHLDELLGDVEVAKARLQHAFKLNPSLRMKALEDEDLEIVWDSLMQ